MDHAKSGKTRSQRQKLTLLGFEEVRLLLLPVESLIATFLITAAKEAAHRNYQPERKAQSLVAPAELTAVEEQLVEGHLLFPGDQHFPLPAILVFQRYCCFSPERFQ